MRPPPPCHRSVPAGSTRSSSRRSGASPGASGVRARSTCRTSQPARVRPGMPVPPSQRRRRSSSRSLSPRSPGGGTPDSGSTLDRLLRQMLTYSDNAAANSTERYFGGSTSGGSALVNTMMRSLGLVDTQMYGGYELQALDGPPRALAGGIPLRADSQPSWGRGKSTTAFDLASLLRAVWLASGGRGPLRAAQPGFSAADGRYLLYLLAHVRDFGKLDREVGRLAGVRVLHKAGWVDLGPTRQRDHPLAGRRHRRHRHDLPACRCRHIGRRARGQGRCVGVATLSRLTPRRPGRLACGPRERQRAPARAPVARVTPSECAAASRCPAPGRRWFGKPGSRH